MQFGRHSYSDPLLEAQRCRNSCALFDFSFVGRAAISGERAEEVLHQFQPRKLDDMRAGTIRYSLRGESVLPGFAVRSDLTIWKMESSHFEIFSGRAQDICDLEKLARGRVEFQDSSSSTCIYAVQGPDSLNKLVQLGADPTIGKLPYFCHQSSRIDGNKVLIGRLGYTGEAGFEIVVEEPEQAKTIWRSLAKVALPAGTIAADILRIEAGFILFLNECRLGVNAGELDMSYFAGGVDTRRRYALVCFQARSGLDCLPFASDQDAAAPDVGEIAVTSANRSQFTEGVLGLGLINASDYTESQLLDPSGRFQGVRIISRPFYDPQKEKPRAPWA